MVVVVSAMGKTTDELVAMAKEVCASPSARELDMLLTTGERHTMALLTIALAEHEVRAISLTGSQAGVVTDQQHGHARVVELRPYRVEDELRAGNVVVVGGFQGVSYTREITTLGRGGSDTTAVALAAALGCDCELYSDVDGVYTGDPHTVPGVRRLAALDYDEMAALSRAGAKVLHADAVAHAHAVGIAIFLRSAGSGGGETIVRDNPRGSGGVRAIASDLAITIRVEFRPGSDLALRLLGDFAGFGLRFLSVDPGGVRGVLSRSQRDDCDQVLGRIGDLLAPHDEHVALIAADHCAVVSCVGPGLGQRGDRTQLALHALHDAHISTRQLHAEGDTIAFVVGEQHAAEAARVLHSRLIEHRA